MCVSALREWPHVFCFQLVIFLLSDSYLLPASNLAEFWCHVWICGLVCHIFKIYVLWLSSIKIDRLHL